MHLNPNTQSLQDSKIRKGEFREIARDIVWKDRNNRKYGRSVDTGGAITRALEAAYRLGLEHSRAHDEIPPAKPAEISQDEAIAWNSIPPRSRAAFECIYRYKFAVILVKNATPWERNPAKWACYWDRGNLLADNERMKFEQKYSLGTLAPIIRLGLMVEETIEGRTLLVATKKADATWSAALAAGIVRERT